MAYGDSVDPKSRMISVILVGIITFLLGWLLVSGLAIDVVKQVIEKLDVVDVTEPPPPEEPPPPPPENKLPPPPPVVVPPSFVPNLSPNVVTNTVPTPPPSPPPPAPVITPPAPPAPPATPDRSRPARPRGNDGSWVTNDDYPPSAQRAEAQGTTAVSLTVSADGRVTGCSVTSSSGNDALDRAACSNIQRRARFEPALDRNGDPTTGSFSRRVRWVLPEE